LSSRDVDRFVNDLLERGGKRGQLSKHTAWTYEKAAKLFLAWAKDGMNPLLVAEVLGHTSLLSA